MTSLRTQLVTQLVTPKLRRAPWTSLDRQQIVYEVLA